MKSPWKLVNRFRAALDAESESDTKFDGYLSTRAEWHASAWGVFAGLLAGLLGDPRWFLASLFWLATRGNGRLSWEVLVKEPLYVISHGLVALIVGVGLRLVFVAVGGFVV